MNKLNIINKSDRFTTIGHPDVFKEIKLMSQHVTDVAGSFKRDILISFLKDHSIKIDWLAGNEALVDMITSGSLKIYHTERLFEAERSNKVFLADLEGYIETELENGPIEARHRNVLSTISSVGPSEGQRYYACAPSPS
ncbi:MAG TPA: hypothetical protein VK658_06755 [Chryseolinea sp.]|nr:hypothetical protein [Chryseolinea sp.]